MGVLMKKVNFVNFLLKNSNSEPNVNKFYFFVSDGPATDMKTRYFVENLLVTQWAEVKCIQLNYTKLSPEELILHKFLKDEFF